MAAPLTLHVTQEAKLWENYIIFNFRNTNQNTFVNSLIIGTAGFIGSNLALRLLKNGNTVIGIDNFSRGSEKNIEL